MPRGNWYLFFQRQCTSKKGLSASDLECVLARQNGLCALSGERLTCLLGDGQPTDKNASVDRIVAGGDYSRDNVQLVCKPLNGFRNNVPLGEFLGWCESVARYNG